MADNEMELRVGTAEREAVASVLAAAMADGRLTVTEYDERLGVAWTAVTRSDLAKLTSDLPAPDPEASVPVREPSAWREYFDEWRWWLGGAVIMTGIWGIQSVTDGELANFWLAWPLGIWAVVLVAMIFFPDDKYAEN